MALADQLASPKRGGSFSSRSKSWADEATALIIYSLELMSVPKWTVISRSEAHRLIELPSQGCNHSHRGPYSPSVAPLPCKGSGSMTPTLELGKVSLKKVGSQESRMKKEQAEDNWEQIAALWGTPGSGL